MSAVPPIKRIAIVAGESSGDILGAGLIRELKKHNPWLKFEGIGGPLMQAEGCESLYPMERLAVMGIVPILKRLPELLKMRKALATRWQKEQPDLFIGIDAPEFNLGLAQKLKSKGIKTVHYVSPSVWAWRPKRIFKIKKAVDLMLCLFPFEQSIYQKHAIDNRCVGHPLADQISMSSDKATAREQLGLNKNTKTICVMPGSRGSEMKFLAEDFIQTAKLVQQFYPEIEFIAPMANAARKAQFLKILEQQQAPPNIRLFDGQSRQVMAASDLILMASGTATLEAMLIKRPMVVAYKVGAISYRIFRKLLIIDTFAIPNLLSGQTVVPEAIQQECTPDALFGEVRAWLEASPERWQTTEALFTDWHQKLKKNADEFAADSILHWYSQQNIKPNV
ncbi:lipid-A-disaccharide synthase [Kangiella sp. TOML190]|uniref:lipid-A-disaccharide synthase n=1 Tax=Kangiella sp. TOML190 TaxID=2931351 RepID=UPI00203DE0D4|nr:lipid-A-disaccharide synthase [Kangiella sp. TOML190]